MTLLLPARHYSWPILHAAFRCSINFDYCVVLSNIIIVLQEALSFVLYICVFHEIAVFVFVFVKFICPVIVIVIVLSFVIVLVGTSSNHSYLRASFSRCYSFHQYHERTGSVDIPTTPSPPILTPPPTPYPSTLIVFATPFQM